MHKTIFVHIYKTQNFITFGYYKTFPFPSILVYEHLPYNKNYVQIVKSKLTRIILAQTIME